MTIMVIYLEPYLFNIFMIIENAVFFSIADTIVDQVVATGSKDKTLRLWKVLIHLLLCLIYAIFCE